MPELYQFSAGTAVALVTPVPPGAQVTLTVPAGGSTVYIGNGTNLTTANGYPIGAGQSVSWTTRSNTSAIVDYVYAMTGSGTQALGLCIGRGGG
jgi:hypothetical protein